MRRGQAAAGGARARGLRVETRTVRPNNPPRSVGAASAKRVVTFVLYYCEDEASGIGPRGCLGSFTLYIYSIVYPLT